MIDPAAYHADQIDEVMLNPRQQRLVDEFLICGNKTEAYRRAGFSVPDDSKRLAARVNRAFNVPAVLAEIARRKEQIALTAGVRLDDVVEEIKRIAFSNIEDFTTLDPRARVRRIDLTRATREQLASVAEITTEEDLVEAPDGEAAVLQRRVRIKMHSKLDALIRLGTWLKAEELLPARVSEDGSRALPAPQVVELPPDEAARLYQEFLKIGTR